MVTRMVAVEVARSGEILTAVSGAFVDRLYIEQERKGSTVVARTTRKSEVSIK